MVAFHSCLLCETVQLTIDDHVLMLNSAEDEFVTMAAQQISAGKLILAEDNIAALSRFEQSRERNLPGAYAHIPFHEYTLHAAPTNIDVAAMNILYQPGNAWIHYGLQLARYALKPGGQLYVTGAKDRGILSVAKRMQESFGNVETLMISKGRRVVRSRKDETLATGEAQVARPLLTPFADGDLDEGTRLLLEALEVHVTDVALDIGSGAGYIGMHIARLARKGQVTMVDTSLAAVDAARHRIEQSGLTNVQVLPSDGIQAVRSQRFDLVATNPPFHLGGVQTTATAERFIREARQVLRPRGRFYLVANRFLKYEPVMRACFKTVEEVGGNTKYKVLRGLI
ncbi:MAG TPA: methyltransferase [Ktedonobacteraceae bacterium]|jgi:16S rRNA (guanine1207-N2)-methyltransferase|nr:methyltransferase [Ktedonobacteraceae bacterium]